MNWTKHLTAATLLTLSLTGCTVAQEDSSPLSGRWTLVGRASQSQDVYAKGDSGQLARKWLQRDGTKLLNSVTPTEGLELTIDDAGKMTETTTGPADFPWFDEEGVLEPKAIPFGGQIRKSKSGYILTLVNNNGPARYDDGDTKIVDRFTLQEGTPPTLLRAMSVVTDEAYGDLHVYLYEKLGTR